MFNLSFDHFWHFPKILWAFYDFNIPWNDECTHLVANSDMFYWGGSSN
jgi:hypothetical protein